MGCKPFLTCMSDIRGKRLERFEGRLSDYAVECGYPSFLYRSK